MSHNRAWIVDGNAAFRAAERSAARRERRGAVRRRRARRAVAMRRRHARHAAATAAGQPPAVPQRCSAAYACAAMTPPRCGRAQTCTARCVLPSRVAALAAALGQGRACKALLYYSARRPLLALVRAPLHAATAPRARRAYATRRPSWPWVWLKRRNVAELAARGVRNGGARGRSADARRRDGAPRGALRCVARNR